MRWIYLGVALWLSAQEPTVPVTFGWDLHASHDGATFELSIDGGSPIPCGTLQVLPTERRCTAPVPPGLHSFRLRGLQQPADLGWSLPVVGTVGATPGLFTITWHQVTSATPPHPTLAINFQPAGAPAFPGYLVDGGAIFGTRGNGQTYGWTVDNTAQTRDRNLPLSPDQRYDTFTHLQHANQPNAVWEIAVPNGTYRVRVVSGDPSFLDSVHRVTAEGVLVVSGTPTATARWVEGTSTVLVVDGRLTLRSGPGGVNTKVCFIDITRQ